MKNIANVTAKEKTLTNNAVLKPRGRAAMLPHGGLPEAIPPYLRELIKLTGGVDGPIGRQFVARPDLEKANATTGLIDPLIEDETEVAPGLVYKYQAGEDEQGEYPGRALLTITRHCAAYCRFCTRGRKVGMPANMESPLKGALSHSPYLSKDQIDESLQYIADKPELNEVIISGGDPLTVKPALLEYTFIKLGDLQRSGAVDIVRVGTRLPIQNPRGLKSGHYKAVSRLKNPRIMVHINHPAELADQTVCVLDRFRTECSGIIMSQTVLLQGVNDDVDTLTTLFNKMAMLGIVPYYLSQNDQVYWSAHFTVSIDRAIDLWQKLRSRLSGVAATARFVVDAPLGHGKIVIPEGDAWEVNYKAGFKDYRGQRFKL